MRPAVLAGPSLFGAPASATDGIDVLPPAGCGDLLRAVQSGYKVIGLVDGYFETAPAVWHKEILYAISVGCTVLGAASMGALRAAECENFGMVGVGEIFAAYRDGWRTSDADVAVTHGPAELGYPLLSLALVDAEDGLERLRRAGHLTQEQEAAARVRAVATFFKDRNWDQVLEGIGLTPEQGREARAWIEQAGPAAKMRDALALLEQLRATPAGAGGSRFIRTRFFDQLVARVAEDGSP